MLDLSVHRGASVAALVLLASFACVPDLESSGHAGGRDDLSGAEEAFPGRTGDLRQGRIQTADGPRDVAYQLIDGQAIVEGDIVLPREPVDGASRAAGIVGKRWPHRRVPYEIDPALPDPQRVLDAIDHYRGVTDLRLVPRQGEVDYVRFVPGAGCSSKVGRIGGRQDVVLAPLCLRGQVIHEIGHTFGLWHEHSRHDRDGFITILRGNIDAGRESNFDRYPSGEDLGAYDYDSIMHYGSFAFSRDPDRPTITRRDGSLIVANRSGLSPGDLAALARMYAGTTDGHGHGHGDGRDHLVGDWNGDGLDDVALRRGARVLMDVDFDARADREQELGSGDEDDQYLVGDWDGDGRDNLAVRRGNRVSMDVDFDGIPDREQTLGDGGGEDQYLVGDWDGDRRDNLAVRRDGRILMDFDFDDRTEFEQPCIDRDPQGRSVE